MARLEDQQQERKRGQRTDERETKKNSWNALMKQTSSAVKSKYKRECMCL